MTKLRFHLLGLAHVATARENSVCPFTQKTLKLAQILKNHGHMVYFYGVAGSQVPCDELIEVLDQEVLEQAYGIRDWSKQIYDYHGDDLAYRTFAKNAIPAIMERKQKNDLLLCPGGCLHQTIAEAVGLLTIESGVGYRGVFAKYRVFDSYAWMHFIYGILGQEDGGWYDAVIPNCFDLTEFPYQAKKEDYLLYFGRIVKRKGVQLAVELAEKTGHQLYIVGQGELDNQREGIQLSNKKHVQYFPAVEPIERAKLLGNAKAVLMPTYYLEPFGMVNVEAQLCGTPVITTDWGAFPETVLHGVTGFRCRTFEEFVWAVRQVETIRPADCRAWAVANYSLERVGAMYEEYFQRINHLFDQGWYQANPARQELDWLKRYYICFRSI